MGIKKRIQSALTVASLAGLWGACAPAPETELPAQPAAAAGSVDPYIAHKDEQSGLPTFVWLTSRSPQPAGKDASAVAWQVLRELAPTYQLSDAALNTVQEKSVHDLGHGSILVKFEQQVDGLDVFLRGVTVAMDQHLRPVAASGNFAPAVRRTAADFAHPPSDAIAAALQHMIGGSLPFSTITPTRKENHYTQFAVAPVQLGEQSYTLAAPARTKQVLFPSAQGLVPAYYVELGVRASDASVRWQSSVISAVDGALLFTKDLTANDAYSYRVWADTSGKFTPNIGPYGDSFMPHPTGQPDGSRPTGKLPQKLVNLQSAPFSKSDPWLLPGATEAKGNNAWAYADIADPDGFFGSDVALLTSAPGTFDYSIDPEADTTANDSARRAAITQLFYTVNYMHDSFYDAGYDEKSGNAQLSNYGRGGVEGDAVKAEAQDSSGLDNANCSTPADGMSPRIQMFLWNNPALLTALAPADLARQYSPGSADFGPQGFSVTANLVLVNDGTGTKTDGCETPFANAAAVAGKIAVLDRGTCGFTVKTKNAQLAGAVGAIIVNNAAGAAPGMTGTDATITIPTLSLSQSDGNLFKTKLAAGTAAQVTMEHSTLLREGSFDNGVIAHEWGHSLSNRLIGNSAGLSTNQSNGLGEGWSDFVALLTMVRPEAAAAPANANWNGTFAVGAFDLNLYPDSYYYGIRRYPYSADMTKNPLTYKYISNGVALPTTPAPNFGSDGADNAELHNTGEVWASMLWDCYTNMLRDTGRYTFDKAQQTMREYLVASLKMTPNAPTLLEARDALLAAMYAHDQTDFTACAASFARRKAGIGAVAPDRSDASNAGAGESTKLGPDVSLVSYTLDDSAQSCDHDGIIDNTETGRLAVIVRNTGTAPLTDATVTVTGDSKYFTFVSGGKVAVPTLAPYQSATVPVDFQVNNLPGISTPTLHLAITAASLVVPRTISLDIKRRMNYNIAVGASSFDTFGVVSKLGWSTAGNTALLSPATPWTQVTDELGGGMYSIPDNGVRSEQYLISPPIVVDPVAKFGFTLNHHFSFETDTMYNYDGGVVEISADNGQTWIDLGTKFASGGYTGTMSVVTEADASERNPLVDDATPDGRPGFVKSSAGYPAYISSLVNLGTAYGGKTVRLRFRVGTDSAGDGPGWAINQITVSGASSKPFAQAVAQPALCTNSLPVVTVTPPEQSVASGTAATLAGAVSDADQDSLVYEWVQLSGPVVTLASPTALTQTITIPASSTPVDVSFALRASDGKGQSEAVAKVTFTPSAGADSSGSSDSGDSGNKGCGCRTAPVKTRAADMVWDFLWVALAGLYCHRRRVPR